MLGFFSIFFWHLSLIYTAYIIYQPFSAHFTFQSFSFNIKVCWRQIMKLCLFSASFVILLFILFIPRTNRSYINPLLFKSYFHVLFCRHQIRINCLLSTSFVILHFILFVPPTNTPYIKLFTAHIISQPFILLTNNGKMLSHYFFILTSLNLDQIDSHSEELETI